MRYKLSIEELGNIFESLNIDFNCNTDKITKMDISNKAYKKFLKYMKWEFNANNLSDDELGDSFCQILTPDLNKVQYEKFDFFELFCDPYEFKINSSDISKEVERLSKNYKEYDLESFVQGNDTLDEDIKLSKSLLSFYLGKLEQITMYHDSIYFFKYEDNFYSFNTYNELFHFIYEKALYRKTTSEERFFDKEDWGF